MLFDNQNQYDVTGPGYLASLSQYTPSLGGGSSAFADLPSFSSAAPTSAVGQSAAGGSWFDSLLGSTNKGVSTPGWGGLALGGVQALGNLALGYKQYGIAKDTLDQNRMIFEKNYEAQKRTTNSRLQDRQRARVASNPGAYQSVSDYMNQNGI